MGRTLEEMVGTEFYAYPAEAETFVVKFGTGCFLADGRNDLLDQKKIDKAAGVLSYLKQQKKNVIGVVSGAVVKGMEYEGRQIRPKDVALRQYLAGKGQYGFMEMFREAFQPYGIIPAQGLPTRHNFASKAEKENLKAQFELSFKDKKGIYLLNTNDTVTNEELLSEFAKSHPGEADDKLMSTDNDVLAFMTAKYIGADALIMASDQSTAGSGGSTSKMNVVSRAVSSGIYVAIAPLDDIGYIVAGGDAGSKFLPDSWAKRNPDPWHFGNLAYVSADFLKAFGEVNPRCVGKKETHLRLKAPVRFDKSKDLSIIECTYSISRPQTIPFIRLKSVQFMKY
ncbi:MAG: hypothetical protein V1702_01115 [Candidatus Woesearchaeota archaeon]